MSRKLGRLREKRKNSVLEKRKREEAIISKRTLPSSVVEFCRKWLYYEPYAYMHPFLESGSHFIANCQARQTGKSFNGMAKLLYLAFRYPGSVFLVTAPKFDQIKNIAFKALEMHLRRMKNNDPDARAGLTPALPSLILSTS